MQPAVSFFFELASPYSYLAGLQIDREVGNARGTVLWEPIDIEKVWDAQGVLDAYRAVRALKSPYIRADVARCAGRAGVIIRPGSMRGRSFAVAKLAYLGLRAAGDERADPFIRQVWRGYFSEGFAIGTAIEIADCVRNLELNADEISRHSSLPEAREALQANVDAAVAAGCFGIPWFTCAGENFFGHDRIDHLKALLGAQSSM